MSAIANEELSPLILVVNDDEVGRYATSRLLQQAGFRTGEAATGQEAIEKARSLPDLVLLDVKLPDIDGYEVCRVLKREPETQYLPVLHISATFLDSASQVRGLEGGADGYLTYPLEPPVLVATIKAHLRVRQSEAQRRELATLLQDVSDAIISFDLDLTVLSWNRGAEQVYGWSESEVLGRNAPELMRPEWNRDEAEEVLAEVLSSGRWQGESEHRHRSGKSLFVYSSLTLARDERGKPSRIVAVNRDITAQRQMELERRALVDELQALNESLEDRVRERTRELREANRLLRNRTDELEALAYSISHDLRAPLRGVDGFSRVLLEDYGKDLDDRARDYLGRVSAGAQRMGELIDHLLSLSRLSRRSLQPVEIDLGALARESFSEMRRATGDRRLELIVEDGLVAHGDEDLLRTLVEHLLHNAVKFTREREVGRIVLGSTGVDGEKVYFVRDNGVGFDDRFVDRLFTAFQRLHPADEYPGTGIGLATVRRIVHRHGGRVWAESPTEEGAVFYFTLGAVSE